MTDFKGIPVPHRLSGVPQEVARNTSPRRASPRFGTASRRPPGHCHLPARAQATVAACAMLAAGARYGCCGQTVREHRLATVCEEAKCPNIGECWNAGTATLMLMGAVCTRACRFCAVDTGNPHGWLDPDEPANAARTVQLMGLEVRRADLGRSRRPAGRRRDAFRRVRARDQAAESRRPQSKR